ncbi:MAG: hypothetical protein KJ574_00945 [Nanoarchaeota archaeon]|nr:hypothetical protein [Nanoarchaeota archaeon]
MQKLQILNTREKKDVINRINKQWGCDFKTDLVFLRSTNDKIYLMTRDFADLDLTKLRIDSMGEYFATLTDTEIRLTIEGSEAIGPIATKNILELNHEDMRSWLKGNDLKLEDIPADLHGFIIMKHKEDSLGTGKLKENTILSYIPKNRRILCED